ncbi:hypothetical protein QBC42DRAFT_180850 [Cladorrhinum samala]|uniref:Uncharacterized protein n=1 Tax=Cladorrhinum samala TaxID=585594 RepID=A0AAV9HK38_9PEZI|nr:hypothetical protein QBC42DRAFT_180850 [Cladorrhinum samala]
MPSFTVKVVGAAAAAYLVAQQVQCPIIAIPLITSAALQTAALVGSAAVEIAGAVIACELGGCNDKRDLGATRRRGMLQSRQAFTAPPGVPQEEFDRCFNDLANPAAKVTVNGPVESNGVQVSGLPASCMNLATVLDGDAAGGPTPTPCGSDCLLYNNLSAADYNLMRDTFNTLKAGNGN